MKTLVLSLLIFIFAVQTNTDTKTFSANGVSFNYPNGWVLQDDTNSDAQQLNLARPNNDVQIPSRGVASGGPEKLKREVEFRQRLEARAVGGLRVPGGPDSHPEKGSGGTSDGQGAASPSGE